MAGILNKLMDFIGIEDVDDEGYNEDYFNDEQQSMAEDNVVSLGNRGRRKPAATTAPMNVMNFRIFFRIEVIPVVMHFAFLLG